MRPERALGILLAGALGWAFWRSAAHEGHVPMGVAISCERAALVDGRLVCDEELPETLGVLCASGLRPLRVADHPLRTGDELRLRRACSGARRVGRMPAEMLAALQVPVDVNVASGDELSSLPGIGPKTAAKIVDGRPYADVDDLLRVKGIGHKRLSQLRSRARVTRKLEVPQPRQTP